MNNTTNTTLITDISYCDVFSNPNIDDSLKSFWHDQGLTDKDFHCQHCGCLMLDIDDLKGVVYQCSKSGKHRFFRKNVSGYVESLQNRSLAKGRFMSGKFFQRKLCWDCFHKEMTECIRKEFAKSKGHMKYNWYRKVLKDEIKDYYPSAWQSATFYFKFLFGMTDEELHKECRKFVTADLEFFINKYGEELGPQKYEEYRKWQKYAGCSIEYFIDKYGEEEGRKKYKQVNRSKAVTKESCIKKYGEKVGKEVFGHYCDVQSINGVKLEYFIEKYGKEEGTKKYEEVVYLKTKPCGNRKFYSDISQKLFKMIDDKLGNFAKDSRWEEKNEEKSIIYEGQVMKPDYLLGDKIIEFNGDFWHMNPQNCLSSDFNSITNSQAFEIWEHDKLRKTIFEGLGFKVHIVWEKDFNSDPYKVLNECCEFLHSRSSSKEFLQDNMDVVLSL